jgi:hypothetical protein
MSNAQIVDIGKPIWVQSGGVGWSPGQILGARINRAGERIIKVGYGRLWAEPREDGGPSHAWSRNGERREHQIRARDIESNGPDKPPPLAAVRRGRRAECHGSG